MSVLPVPALAIAVAVLSTVPALASPAPVVMTLKDHRFTPAAVTVPPGEKITIQLINHDMATEEFDSHDLKVEKLVTPGGRVTFTVGPLTPGAYAFMGEFHPATAQGRIVAQAGR
ncbi:MAG: cupredoxin domain-containing protein [Caulobacteraceae bacterium]